jgi:hypothetical protein
MPKGTGPEIFPLVQADLEARRQKGIATYGEALRANNGRDALQDAYEEALDLAVYLRQAREERQADREAFRASLAELREAYRELWEWAHQAVTLLLESDQQELVTHASNFSAYEAEDL